VAVVSTAPGEWITKSILTIEYKRPSLKREGLFAARKRYTTEVTAMTWNADLSTTTIDEVVKLQTENRASDKETRLEIRTLVNRRLAKEITAEEYVVKRKIANQATEEFRRRSTLLSDELASRAGRRR
jgi:histone H3/H4